jgi:MFS transporter, DHA2 family, multidrug resistance protein
MVGQFVHDPPFLKNRARPAIDYIGIGLLAVGLATLQTLLEQGERYDWFSSGFIVGMAALSVICLSVFVWWELRTGQPAVDLRLLKNLPFTVGTLIGGVLGLSLFSSMFLLPLFTEDLLRYTPMQSGLALMPRSLTMLMLMPVTGYLYNRLGAPRMIAIGLAIAGYAGWMMSGFTTDTGSYQFLMPMVIQGVGFSMIFVALSTAALATVPRERMTNATGLYNLVRTLGGSFGVAVTATMLQNHITTVHARLTERANPYNPGFQHWMALVQARFRELGVDARTAHVKALALLEQVIQQQATVIGFDYLFSITALLLLVCLPLAFTLKHAARGGKAAGPRPSGE